MRDGTGKLQSMSVAASVSLFDAQTGGARLGSFPNLNEHLRSLVNGQESLVCPPGRYLINPSAFSNGAVTTPGGLHCAPQTDSRPVFCCR